MLVGLNFLIAEGVDQYLTADLQQRPEPPRMTPDLDSQAATSLTSSF